MLVTQAITRMPGADFAAGLTTSQLGEPDFETMLAQHADYETLLRELGVKVTTLPPLPELPDAYFVEDVAIVLADTAIVTRPGAVSRRGEPGHLQATLRGRWKLLYIEAPGTLDGGDVLIAGGNACIGISQRTNVAGAEQLASIVRRFGYRCTPIEVGADLHLKSSVSQVADDALLMTEQFAAHPAFSNYRRIVVPSEDTYAANALWINGRVIIPAGFPNVAERLGSAELRISELNVGEARKMDGGLTCLSLRF